MRAAARIWRPNALALAAAVTGKPVELLEQSRVLKDIYGAVDGLFSPDPERPTLIDLFDLRVFETERFEDWEAAVSEALRLQPQLRPWFERLAQVAPRGVELLPKLVPFLATIENVDFEMPPGQGQPGAVHRIGRYRADPDVRFGDAHWSEPVQTVWSDCWLIASLSALAWAGSDALNARLANTDYDPARRPWHDWHFADGPQLRVEADLPFDFDGTPLHATCTGPENWPGIVEKAWAMDLAGGQFTDDVGSRRNPSYVHYSALNHNAFPHRAMERILPGRRGGALAGTQSEPLSRVLLPGTPVFRLGGGTMELVDASGRANLPIVAWTNERFANRASSVRAPGTGFSVWPQHAYTVLGSIAARGSTYIALRDPIAQRLQNGTLPATQAWSVNIDQPGVIALEPSTFDQLFAWIGWLQ